MTELCVTLLEMAEPCVTLLAMTVYRKESSDMTIHKKKRESPAKATSRFIIEDSY
jgi:hypothetical protein